MHALNVLRLILSDGALGPDLNSYIPETAQLAVRGFTAPQWAVRNSCMMVRFFLCYFLIVGRIYFCDYL